MLALYIYFFNMPRGEMHEEGNKGLLGGIIVIVVILAVVIAGIVLVRRGGEDSESTGGSAALGGGEAISETDTPKAVVDSVSKHILLPAGEITVATINDADNLRSQVPGVYQYAKTGDKILLHPERIIIYDPVKDRVVDVIRNPATFGAAGAATE